MDNKQLLQKIIKEYKVFEVIECSDPYRVNKDRFIYQGKFPYIFDSLAKKNITADNELETLNNLHYAIICLLKESICNDLVLHIYNEGTLHEQKYITYKELYKNLQKEHIELQNRYDEIKKIIIENLTYAKK